MSRSSSGRQRATRTSRSRVVSPGGASSASVSAPPALRGSRKMRWVWPTRISSPWRSRCEDQIRSPLTHVPLEEPRSVTHQPAGNRSRIAWRWLAMGSCSRATSFSAALPMVVRSASSENRQLPAPEITSICGSTRPSLRTPQPDRSRQRLAGASEAPGRAGKAPWCHSWFHVERIWADLEHLEPSCHAATGLR